MQKKLPLQCPSCQANLKVKKLHCSGCGTEVDGLYDFPLLVSFSREEQDFILNFVKTSGSLKEMAGIMDLSYPTVRNYVDDIIAKIKQLEKAKKQ
jgi:hypothetical protein